MNGQAKTGGEFGINGEWYKGGEFLPSYETTVKGAQKATISKGKKFEVAPYVWEPAPADDMLSIYDCINSRARDNREQCEFIKGQGFIGFKFTEADTTTYGNVYNDRNDTWNTIEISAEQIEWVKGLIVRFNNGERWLPLSENPFHYKNLKKI